MHVLYLDSIRLRLKQHEVRLQLAAVNFERDLFAVIHDDLSLGYIFGRHRVEPHGRAFETLDVAFRHGDRTKSGIGRRVENELHVGNLRRIDRFGAIRCRPKGATDRPIAERFFQARDLGAELSRAKIFHGYFLNADGFTALVGAGPRHQLQGRRLRARGRRSDRRRRAADYTESLGLDFNDRLRRWQMIERPGQHADRAADPGRVEKNHRRYRNEQQNK